MKDNDADALLFESWFPMFKTIQWNEQISSPYMLSGSNIISGYINLSENKKRKSLNMKCRKKSKNSK